MFYPSKMATIISLVVLLRCCYGIVRALLGHCYGVLLWYCYGVVFSVLFLSLESAVSSLGLGPATPPNNSIMKRLSGLVSGLNSVETMQKSVINAFSLKYSGFSKTYRKLCLPSLFFQRWLLVGLKFRMITCRVWEYKFMGCLRVFLSTLHSSTVSSSYSRFWQIWKRSFF